MKTSAEFKLPVVTTVSDVTAFKSVISTFSQLLCHILHIPCVLVAI